MRYEWDNGKAAENLRKHGVDFTDAIAALVSKTGTTRVHVKPGDALPRGNTDWARLNALTEEEIMAAALSDPDALPLSAEQLAKMRRVSRVRCCGNASA